MGIYSCGFRAFKVNFRACGSRIQKGCDRMGHKDDVRTDDKRLVIKDFRLRKH